MKKVSIQWHGVQILRIALVTCTLPLFTWCTQCNVVTIFSMKTADCARTGLTSMPQTLDLDIQVLRFDDNNLTKLSYDDLQRYPHLQEIYFIRNKIQQVEPIAFQNQARLQILDMESNLLTEIPSSSLKRVPTLRILRLKKNPIHSINAGAFQYSPLLEELNLEGCGLDTIHAAAFKGLAKLIELNLADNHLMALSSDMQPLLPDSIQVLRIYRNPWICDCKLRWLRRWITGTRGSLPYSTGVHSDTPASVKINWDFVSNTPECSGPESIRGIGWKFLTARQFACPSRILSSGTSGLSGLKMQEGGNVSLECSATGNPEPIIEWSRSQGRIASRATVVTIAPTPITAKSSSSGAQSARSTSHDGELNVYSSLTLPWVSTEDSDTYYCSATNPAGRAEVFYRLQVEAILAGSQPYATSGGSLGLSHEVVVGAIVASILVLVLLISCVLVGAWCSRRRRGVEWFCWWNRERERDRNEYRLKEYTTESSRPLRRGNQGQGGLEDDDESFAGDHLRPDREELGDSEEEEMVNSFEPERYNEANHRHVRFVETSENFVSYPKVGIDDLPLTSREYHDYQSSDEVCRSEQSSSIEGIGGKEVHENSTDHVLTANHSTFDSIGSSSDLINSKTNFDRTLLDPDEPEVGVKHHSIVNGKSDIGNKTGNLSQEHHFNTVAVDNGNISAGEKVADKPVTADEFGQAVSVVSHSPSRTDNPLTENILRGPTFKQDANNIKPTGSHEDSNPIAADDTRVCGSTETLIIDDTVGGTWGLIDTFKSMRSRGSGAKQSDTDVTERKRRLKDTANDEMQSVGKRSSSNGSWSWMPAKPDEVKQDCSEMVTQKNSPGVQSVLPVDSQLQNRITVPKQQYPSEHTHLNRACQVRPSTQNHSPIFSGTVSPSQTNLEVNGNAQNKNCYDDPRENSVTKINQHTTPLPDHKIRNSSCRKQMPTAGSKNQVMEDIVRQAKSGGYYSERPRTGDFSQFQCRNSPTAGFQGGLKQQFSGSEDLNRSQISAHGRETDSNRNVVWPRDSGWLQRGCATLPRSPMGMGQRVGDYMDQGTASYSRYNNIGNGVGGVCDCTCEAYNGVGGACNDLGGACKDDSRASNINCEQCYIGNEFQYHDYPHQSHSNYNPYIAENNYVPFTVSNRFYSNMTNPYQTSMRQPVNRYRSRSVERSHPVTSLSDLMSSPFDKAFLESVENEREKKHEKRELRSPPTFDQTDLGTVL